MSFHSWGTPEAGDGFDSRNQLNVFISSKILEFSEERAALYDFVPSLLKGVIGLHSWVFEKDTTASEIPSREIWLEKLEACSIYVGLFGELYGEWTLDEFEIATKLGLSRLIFVKKTDHREQKLVDFINQISEVNKGLTPQYFESVSELKLHVENALRSWLWNRLSKNSRYKLLEILKKCNDDYWAWCDSNLRLPLDQQNDVEHLKIIRKAIRVCEDAEDTLDNEGKRCLHMNADSPNWDGCYLVYKTNLTYIARMRLCPYFVTGNSASEGPADRAGAQKMGSYHQRNINALDDAISRFKELL